MVVYYNSMSEIKHDPISETPSSSSSSSPSAAPSSSSSSLAATDGDHKQRHSGGQTYTTHGTPRILGKSPSGCTRTAWPRIDHDTRTIHRSYVTGSLVNISNDTTDYTIIYPMQLTYESSSRPKVDIVVWSPSSSSITAIPAGKIQSIRVPDKPLDTAIYDALLKTYESQLSCATKKTRKQKAVPKRTQPPRIVRQPATPTVPSSPSPPATTSSSSSRGRGRARGRTATKRGGKSSTNTRGGHCTTRNKRDRAVVTSGASSSSSPSPSPSSSRHSRSRSWEHPRSCSSDRRHDHHHRQGRTHRSTSQVQSHRHRGRSRSLSRDHAHHHDHHHHHHHHRHVSRSPSPRTCHGSSSSSLTHHGHDGINDARIVFVPVPSNNTVQQQSPLLSLFPSALVSSLSSPWSRLM
jgi:hypothetical protein